jgi:hypothetical protein
MTNKQKKEKGIVGKKLKQRKRKGQEKRTEKGTPEVGGPLNEQFSSLTLTRQ